MTLHLEGLGVLGCYIGWRLFNDGIPFTWHDSGEQVTAWRACTGAVFPTGHSADLRAMAAWTRHLDEPGFNDHTERAAYVYCSKRPPHMGRYGWQDLGNGIKLGEVPSLHLNAQRWVPWTRRVFNHYQLDAAPPDARVIVTHGFGARLARYMWGWTVPVRVWTTADFGELRPSIYFRRGRFVMAYAYPIPGTGLWYAGSSLISQKAPRQLDTDAKFERWRREFVELGRGYVLGVERAGDAMQGWRPVPYSDREPLVRCDVHDGRADVLTVRPLWHSGVRHAPLVYDALKEALA